MQSKIIAMLRDISLFYKDQKEISKWIEYVQKYVHESDPMGTALMKLHNGANIFRLDSKIYFIISKNIRTKASK